MNTPKHTPGPWIVDGVYIIRGPKRCVVAKLIDSKEPYETKVANGHMLAAAPAMYEAGKPFIEASNLFEVIDDGGGDRYVLTVTKAEYVALRAALAQAEGRG